MQVEKHLASAAAEYGTLRGALASATGWSRQPREPLQLSGGSVQVGQAGEAEEEATVGQEIPAKAEGEEQQGGGEGAGGESQGEPAGRAAPAPTSGGGRQGVAAGDNDEGEAEEDEAGSAVKMCELEVVDWLGKGAVGKVYLVRHTETQELCVPPRPPAAQR
jgi:hypothetical protein